MYCRLFVFFFQAEDGIRDSSVTGVQTCALPISRSSVDRACRQGGARVGAARRDGRTGRERRAGRRGAARGAPVRRGRVRAVSTRRPRAVKARLSTDGGARGNPGPAAYGYVLETEDGTVLDARGERIGVATNNVAGHTALIPRLPQPPPLRMRQSHSRPH